MVQFEILAQVLDAIESVGIEYMIVGSFASGYWGRPRMTFDADVVVTYGPEQARDLAQRLSDDYYAPDFALIRAARERSEVNVIHQTEAFKVDLWVRRDQPYDCESFERRRLAPIGGRPRWVCSPEDLILSKLQWHVRTGSERQFEDARGVYEIQRAMLDDAYLDRWATELGLVGLLTHMRNQAALPV